MDESEKEVVKTITDINLTIITNLEVAFNNMYNITQACHYAGISRQTYYTYLLVPEFQTKMDEAKNMPLRKLREVALKQATEGEGDGNLALRILTLTDPDFKPKSSLEIDPNAESIEQKIKDFLNDPANRPDNLPDDSEETATEPDNQT